MANFMVGIHISPMSEQTFEETKKIFENKYLVNFMNDPHSIIISNKNCKINGYASRWLVNIF